MCLRLEDVDPVCSRRQCPHRRRSIDTSSRPGFAHVSSETGSACLKGSEAGGPSLRIETEQPDVAAKEQDHDGRSRLEHDTEAMCLRVASCSFWLLVFCGCPCVWCVVRSQRCLCVSLCPSRLPFSGANSNRQQQAKNELYGKEGSFAVNPYSKRAGYEWEDTEHYSNIMDESQYSYWRWMIYMSLDRYSSDRWCFGRNARETGRYRVWNLNTESVAQSHRGGNARNPSKGATSSRLKICGKSCAGILNTHRHQGVVQSLDTG